MPSLFFRAGCLVALIAAAACTIQMPRHDADSSTKQDPVAAPAQAPSVAIPGPAQVDSQAVNPPVNDTAVLRFLVYADRIRSFAPAELAAEFTRLGDARSPGDQMQLSLALAQLRQSPELIRAQDLLIRVLANISPEAVAFHPLARLLANRFAEQRRFEDLLDKQVQQTRDAQRRLDQTTERLEALKAIERSLGARAPTASPSAKATSPTPEKTVRPRQSP